MKSATTLFMTFCAIAALAQTNYVPISTLSQTAEAGYYIYGSEIAAQSFTTGSAVSDLYDVSLYFVALNGGTYGPLNCSLYSDSNGSPGSSLAALSGIAFPTNIFGGIYTYTNPITLPLAANTIYWIVLSSPGTTGGGAYFWYVEGTGVDPASYWTLGLAKTNFNFSGHWTTVPGNSMFSVTVTNPQPPALSIFQPIVLNYPNPGFPFFLQQNTNLVTTNWVTVTNAIQLAAVNSNQAVFIVSPAARQMFYRLSLQ